MAPLIGIEDLLLQDKAGVVIVDVRAGADGYQRYQQGHLEGALFASLEDHLSEVPQDASQGGRHPLPSVEKFAQFLSRLGITPDGTVIIYDDKANAMGGARLWWMLKAIGHKNVQVLNGGLKAATDRGVTLSTGEALPSPGESYPVPSFFKGSVGISEVAEAAHDDTRMVVDVRESARYLGHTEPIDLVAGHIPGAVNAPYANHITADGKFKPAEDLKEHYTKTFGDVSPEHVIVHCGSGVTACHTLLALASAGIEGPQLYVGSWSEWSRNFKADGN